MQKQIEKVEDIKIGDEIKCGNIISHVAQKNSFTIYNTEGEGCPPAQFQSFMDKGILTVTRKEK